MDVPSRHRTQLRSAPTAVGPWPAAGGRESAKTACVIWKAVQWCWESRGEQTRDRAWRPATQSHPSHIDACRVIEPASRRVGANTHKRIGTAATSNMPQHDGEMPKHPVHLCTPLQDASIFLLTSAPHREGQI